MLHHQREGAKNQISSFNPAYQIHSNRDGTGDIEFDFWSARKTWYYDTLNSVDGGEIEFQVQACVEERFGDCSSPLWRANKVTDASPLLPSNYFYSNLSPATRTKAIEEGRKELIEMIRNMPESSYELSLRDMVDEQHASDEVKGKAVSEDESFCSKTEAQTKKQKKKRKKRKAGPISRSGSMEADSFLIKLFFPSSLSFKKKSKAENSSKVSPSPSYEGSGKPDEKQWWIKRIFIRRNYKNRDDNSSSNSSTSRHANKTSLPACWLSFLFKKSKAKRQEEFIIICDCLVF